MSGVERDKLRIKETAEVFTPTPLVQEMLYNLEMQDSTLFSNPNKTFLDNSCGDGQFLSEVVIQKMKKSNCTLEQALKTTYGVDLMEDNVNECRIRLAGPNPTPEILEIVNKNIVCHDALTYDYNFGENPQP
jgi:type I restriction-modification system DNA methylase subunit